MGLPVLLSIAAPVESQSEPKLIPIDVERCGAASETVYLPMGSLVYKVVGRDENQCILHVGGERESFGSWDNFLQIQCSIPRSAKEISLKSTYYRGAIEPIEEYCEARRNPDTYRVDWPALEDAWTQYLDSPSSDRATRIQELLPAGGSPSRTAGDFNVEAAMRIFGRVDRLGSLISQGKPHAYDVAFALMELSEGAYAEWLAAILGGSARSQPRSLLSALHSNRARRLGSCYFANVVEPGGYNPLSKYQAEIEARRAAISSVSDARFWTEKQCVLSALNQELPP